jgi:hypothetical protein
VILAVTSKKQVKIFDVMSSALFTFAGYMALNRPMAIGVNLNVNQPSRLLFLKSKEEGF